MTRVDTFSNTNGQNNIWKKHYTCHNTIEKASKAIKTMITQIP